MRREVISVDGSLEAKDLVWAIGVDLGGAAGARPPIIELGGKGILLPPKSR